MPAPGLFSSPRRSRSSSAAKGQCALPLPLAGEGWLSRERGSVEGSGFRHGIRARPNRSADSPICDPAHKTHGVELSLALMRFDLEQHQGTEPRFGDGCGAASSPVTDEPSSRAVNSYSPFGTCPITSHGSDRRAQFKVYVELMLTKRLAADIACEPKLPL